MMPTISDFTQIPLVDSFSLSSLAHASDLFNLLAFSVDLGIFEQLKERKNYEELAETLNTNSRLTKKVLNALVSENLLSSEGDYYQINSVSKTYLLKDSPYYQGNMLDLYRNNRKTRWDNLSETLHKEKITPPDMKAVFSPSFVYAMAEGSVTGQIQATVNALDKEEALINAKKLLDVGGGHGLYGIAFTQKYPGLSATIMDLPPVIAEVTDNFIKSYNTDQVTTLPGDYEKDDLKGPYDVIFASDTLYRPKEEIVKLLARFADYLSPDGVIISKHWHIDDLIKDKTAVWFDLMLSLTSPEDRVHDSRTFLSCIDDAGLEVIKQIPLNHTAKPTVITISRRIEA